MSNWDIPHAGKSKLGPEWNEAGRLAMRAEGDAWNAYYALPNTMEGALLLGSVKLAFVENRTRRDQFIAFMRDCVGDILKEKYGERPHWRNEKPAPDDERE